MKTNDKVKIFKLGICWGGGHSINLTVIFPVQYAVKPNCKWRSDTWSLCCLGSRVDIETGTVGTNLQELTLHSFCCSLHNLLSEFPRRHFITVKINKTSATSGLWVGKKCWHWERENIGMTEHKEKGFGTKCSLRVVNKKTVCCCFIPVLFKERGFHIPSV